jgi:excisionase family DNA binding protein
MRPRVCWLGMENFESNGKREEGRVEAPKLAQVDPASQDRGVPFFDKSSIASDPAIEMLTIPEVAQVLKISVTGVRRLQQGRQLPFVKVGGSIRFLKRDIISYLEGKRTDSIGQ